MNRTASTGETAGLGPEFVLGERSSPPRGPAALLERLAARMSAIVFELAPDGRTLYVNPAVTAVTGYRPEELIGKNWWAVLTPDECGDGARALRTLLREGDVSRFEIDVRTRSGALASLEVSTAREGEKGKDERIACFAVDVTDRGRWREQSYFQASLLDQVRNAVVATDLAGRVQYWNRQAQALYQWSVEEALGRSRFELLAPGGGEHVDALLDALWKKGHWEGEFLARRKDGESICVHAAETVLRDSRGNLSGFLSVSFDMTARKAAEQELLRQKEVLQTIFDRIPATVVFLDSDGRILLANAQFQKLLGWTVEEAQASGFWEQVHPDAADRQAVLDYIRRPTAGWRTFTIRTRSGRTVETQWATVVLSDGRRLGIGQDVTERRQLEDQLKQSQKMEAIGRLAGGVAHDFNNLLTVILGFSESLLAAGGLAPMAANQVKEIKKAGERAATLTRQLLTFSRRQPPCKARLNLNAAIREMEAMLRRLVGDRVELSLDLDEQPWLIEADDGQVSQVLLNLAANARDAMPSGGRLTIETRVVAADDAASDIARAAPCHLPPDRRHVEQTAAVPFVMLAMHDTGCGISAEVKSRMFEPFFTTKPSGRGVGMGLATVYGVVAGLGGGIAVFSEPDRGASVRLYFPGIAPAPAVAAPAISSQQASACASADLPR